MAKLKDTEIKGNLSIDGNVQIAGDVTIDGDTSATNLPVSMSMTQIPSMTYTMKDYKTYIGTVHQSNDNKWYDMISVRHENGNVDKNGQDYGLMIFTQMQEDGDLMYEKQTSASSWTGQKTILDSNNVGSYAIPKNTNTGLNINAKGTGTYTLPAMDTRNKDYLMIVRAVNPAYFKFCILSPNSDRTSYWCHTIYSAGAIDVSVSGNILSIINNSPYQLEFRINLVPLL